MPTLWCKQRAFDNISAILWDKDGTLADSHPFLQQLAKLRSQQLENRVPGIGAPLTAAFGCQPDAYDPTGLMAVGTRYENEIAAAAYIAARGRSWTESLQLARQAFGESDRQVSRKANFTPPFPGISRLLQSLRETGLKVAVLSGDTTANIQDFLACYGLSPWVDWCAGSEAEPIKPDPRMVWQACESLTVTPEQAIVIGDSGLDYQLALNGNVRAFISVTWGGSPPIAGADAVIESPAQLTIRSLLEESPQAGNTLR
jgi:phosphoglycolate phosphatase